MESKPIVYRIFLSLAVRFCHKSFHDCLNHIIPTAPVVGLIIQIPQPHLVIFRFKRIIHKTALVWNLDKSLPFCASERNMPLLLYQS